MADVLFKCGQCSKHLVIDASAAGRLVKCMDCGQVIRVPESADSFKCLSCSHDLAIPHNDVGEGFHCPKCRAELMVPTTPTTKLPPKPHGGWTTSPG